MTKQTSKKKKILPAIEPQPVQLKFLTAKESIVFFGGGAKQSWFHLKKPL